MQCEHTDAINDLHGGELRIDAEGLEARRQAGDGAVRTVVFGQPLGVMVLVGRRDVAGHEDGRGRTACCCNAGNGSTTVYADSCAGC